MIILYYTRIKISAQVGFFFLFFNKSVSDDKHSNTQYVKQEYKQKEKKKRH